MRDDVKIGYIVDVPAGVDDVCLVRHRIRVAEISAYGITGPRVRADLTALQSRSVLSYRGYMERAVPWDIVAKATIIEHQPVCVRCHAAAPTPGFCCSSHGKELCHRCYRYTHFVERCGDACKNCAAEGLDPGTRVEPAPAWVKPAKPKAIRLTGPQIELLTDIATGPQMYVRTFGRWGKTAECLKDLGLANLKWCEGQQTEVTITEAGRAEAVRRGIIPAAESIAEGSGGAGEAAGDVQGVPADRG